MPDTPGPDGEQLEMVKGLAVSRLRPAGEPGTQIQRWRGLPKLISKVKGYGAAQSRYRND